MPLLEQYYTLSEALSAIRARLPDESAEKNLIDVLHASRIDSFIICAKSGKTYPLPGNVWKSADGRFKPDFDTGTAEIEEWLVMHKTPYTSKPKGSWSRDGQLLPYCINGEVHIVRPQLDTFLDNVGSAEQRRAATRKDENDCEQWLIGLMRAADKPVKPKTEYMDDAKTMFSVGTNAFNRAWAKAISTTDKTEWSRPGRKS